MIATALLALVLAVTPSGMSRCGDDGKRQLCHTRDGRFRIANDHESSRLPPRSPGGSISEQRRKECAKRTGAATAKVCRRKSKPVNP